MMKFRCFAACLKHGIVLFVLLIAISNNNICFADIPADSLRISEYPVYNSLMPGGFIKFGIQTGYVHSKVLDAGFDFGGRISQRFIHPFFQLTSQLHFWSASRKNHNTGVISIEESFTYNIPIRRNAFLNGGFTLAYMSILDEDFIVENGVTDEVDTWSSDIAPYMTFGLEYFLDTKRSFFIETKFGSSDISKEVHILTGLNFFFLKKKAD